MSSLIFNPSNVGNGSVTLNIFGDDKQYNINLPKTNATLIGSVNGKSANEDGSVTIDVGVKSVNGVTPDSEGNVTVKVQSIASNSDAIGGTDNTKMMTPLRTKESVQQFSPTDYVTNLSVSGQTVTFTKKNGTSGSITTQDTKYTHPNSGVKAGTYNSVTVNEQGHVTGGSNVNYVISVNGLKPNTDGNVTIEFSDNLPVGTIIAYGGSSAPVGFLPTNGAQVNRTTYKNLFDAIGTKYGSGNGSTTFNLPNITSNKIATDVSVSISGNGNALRLTDGTSDYVFIDYRWDGQKGVGLSENSSSYVSIGTVSNVSKAGFGNRAIGFQRSGNIGLSSSSYLTGVNVMYCIKY